MKNKFLFIPLFIFIILLFINYDVVVASSIDAVNIWLFKVFPYLFIMFTINDILINLNFEKIFTTTTPFIFIMSLLSGAPTNAFLISLLKKQEKIDEESANYSLLFTYFSNPLFLFSILSLLFNKFIALKLIIIHYLSNIIIYFLVRKNIKNNHLANTKKSSFNLGFSIKKSMNTLIMILGTITFFMVLTNILTKTFALNELFTTILKGILEVTQGLNSLNNINLSLKIKEILAISFISFGGISIHSQVKCLLDEENLKYSYFFKGRIIQTAISIILTALT